MHLWSCFSAWQQKSKTALFNAYQVVYFTGCYIFLWYYVPALRCTNYEIFDFVQNSTHLILTNFTPKVTVKLDMLTKITNFCETTTPCIRVFSVFDALHIIGHSMHCTYTAFIFCRNSISLEHQVSSTCGIMVYVKINKHLGDTKYRDYYQAMFNPFYTFLAILYYTIYK